MPISTLDTGLNRGAHLEWVPLWERTNAPHTKPHLPPGVRFAHNEAPERWVLLRPKRLFKADAVVAEILDRQRRF
jgi:hypothetical protein